MDPILPTLRPKYEGKVIVVLGTFSPVIFHPSWFAKQELVRPQEAESAEIEIVSQKVTKFTSDWLNFQVTENRVQAMTADPVFYETLRDLVIGLLEKMAEFAPVEFVGLNHEYHFQVESEERWHQVGHVLAPKKYWSSLSNQLGLRSIVIEGQRTDDLSGLLLARVTPSERFSRADNEYGVYLHLNDHIEIPQAGEIPGSGDQAANIIGNRWPASVRLAAEFAQEIMGLAD